MSGTRTEETKEERNWLKKPHRAKRKEKLKIFLHHALIICDENRLCEGRTFLVGVNEIKINVDRPTIQNLESKERLSKFSVLRHAVQYFRSCFTHDPRNIATE